MAMLITSFLCVTVIKISLAFPDSKNSDMPCDIGWYHFRDKCYIAGGYKDEERLTWTDAVDRCKSYGANLASIHSEEEQDFVVSSLLRRIQRWSWIGLNDRDKQGDFRWTDGSHYDYSKWKTNEPSALNGVLAEDCVILLFYGEQVGQWNDYLCDSKEAYICKKKAKNPSALKPPPIGAHCPKDLNDWRDLGGEYCYYIETTKPLNFYEANFDCQSRGGQMLSLHSQEETNILKPLLRDKEFRKFIGLIRHKAYDGEKFGWTDGSEFSYQNFYPSEPNNPQEKCVELHGHTMKWNDVNCGNELGYICSVKKIDPNSGRKDDLSDCENYCIARASYLLVED